MAVLAELPLTNEQAQFASTVYRMVGKRDAGLHLNPAIVPVYLLSGLFGLYQEYLVESEASQEVIDKAKQMMNSIEELGERHDNL